MADMKGLSTVLANLNREIKKIELHTKEGLTEAALVVKADAVRNAPIDLGNLRGSGFIMVTDSPPDNSVPQFTGDGAGRLAASHTAALGQARSIVGKKKNGFVGIVGFSAYYATFVHEMPSYYNFNSGGNKFLQKALMKNQKRVQQILYKHARIK